MAGLNSDSFESLEERPGGFPKQLHRFAVPPAAREVPVPPHPRRYGSVSVGLTAKATTGSRRREALLSRAAIYVFKLYFKRRSFYTCPHKNIHMAGAVLTPLDVLWQWLAGDRSAFRGGAYHAPKPASSPLCCPGLIRHWGGVLGSTRGGHWEGLLGGTRGAPASPPQGLAHRLPRAPGAEGGRAEVCQQPWGRSLFAITGLLEAGREWEGLGAVRGRRRRAQRQHVLGGGRPASSRHRRSLFFTCSRSRRLPSAGVSCALHSGF